MSAFSPEVLLRDIGLGIMFAAAAGQIARAVRQPMILGYVLGGVLLGKELGLGWVTDTHSIELISEIGLLLLLFIIGLEINIRELVSMGRSVLVLGLTQFPLCVLLGLVVAGPLVDALGGHGFDRLYLAIAFALSSTLIVVKLLHDKFEVSTVSGRLTVGILVMQDLWAVGFMTFQPNLQDPRVDVILRSAAEGGLLVVSAFAASRYLLQPMFLRNAKTPEAVVLLSMAWCFLLCGLAEGCGLSREIGSLIAGVSIAAFPFGADVASKLAGVRDFFVTLFFVSLGLKVPQPSVTMVTLALLSVGFVIASRLLAIVPISMALGTGMRIGSVTALNLAQVSEFSLVILSLGAGYGHVSGATSSFVLTTMLVASVISSYIILANDRLARGLIVRLHALGVHDRAGVDATVSAGKGDEEELQPIRDIVVLGCFREGEAFLEVLCEKAPDLRSRVLVVDYSPAVGERLAQKGMAWIYGDLAHPQTLLHAGVDQASVIVCPIPDAFLKGTTNRRLLSQLLGLAPQARPIMCAENQAEAVKLLAEGAAKVIVPARVSGKGMFHLLHEVLGN